MGTSKSAAELAGKMNRVATAIPRATRKGITDASLNGKNTIYRVAAQRGVYKSSRIAGGKWSAGYDIKGGGQGRKITSLLRIRGPFHLVESNTDPHVIPRARGQRSRNGTRSNRRYRERRTLLINGQLRRKVNHPGTTGKFIFRDAKKEIVRNTPPVIQNRIVLEMSQALNG